MPPQSSRNGKDGIGFTSRVRRGKDKYPASAMEEVGQNLVKQATLIADAKSRADLFI